MCTERSVPISRSEIYRNVPKAQDFDKVPINETSQFSSENDTPSNKSPTFSEVYDVKDSAELDDISFVKDGSPAEESKLSGGKIEVVLPPSFGSNRDPALHKKNCPEYNNCTTKLFETSESQNHSINNKKEFNEVIIEDGSNLSEIENSPQGNQNGIGKAMPCVVNVQFALSFDPGKPIGSKKFLKDEQHGQRDKEILHLEFFQSQHLLIKLFRRWLW